MADVRQVRLHPLCAGDAAAWAALHGDAVAMAHVAPPRAYAAARRGYDAAMRGKGVRPPRRRTWTIVADDAFAGVAGLVFDAPGTAELGAILAPETHGRGVATRALALVLAHAFAAWPLRTVHTRHAAGHVAAAGLMRTHAFARLADDAAGAWRWQRTTAPAARGARDILEPID